MAKPKRSTPTISLVTLRQRANQRNAQASTGPRSRRGKRRVRENALKHGLAAGPVAKKIPAHQVEALVVALVGHSADPASRQAAVNFALAHLYWLRVRTVQRRILRCKLRAQQFLHEPEEIVAQRLLVSDPELRALMRYERRAANARLNAAKAMEHGGPPVTISALPAT